METPTTPKDATASTSTPATDGSPASTPSSYEFTGILGQRIGLFYKGVPWIWDTDGPPQAVTLYPADGPRGLTPTEGIAYKELLDSMFTPPEGPIENRGVETLW